jgi:hypothetical protein
MVEKVIEEHRAAGLGYFESRGLFWVAKDTRMD